MDANDDMIGKNFGRLTVLKKTTHRKHGRVMFLCLCECGNTTYANSSDLKRSRKRSCGCLRHKNGATHDRSSHPLYKTWNSIKYRCYNKNEKRYADYGGRGIKMCDRWLESFDNFYEDMGDKPTPKHSLDRIDVNGNYEPSNCRWADTFTQAQNTRLETNSKTKIKNIILYYDDVYLCRITRKGKERRYLTKKLDDAIKVRNYWLMEYSKNSEMWIYKTINNLYEKDIENILNTKEV